MRASVCGEERGRELELEAGRGVGLEGVWSEQTGEQGGEEEPSSGSDGEFALTYDLSHDESAVEVLLVFRPADSPQLQRIHLNKQLAALGGGWRRVGRAGGGRWAAAKQARWQGGAGWQAESLPVVASRAITGHPTVLPTQSCRCERSEPRGAARRIPWPLRAVVAREPNGWRSQDGTAAPACCALCGVWGVPSALNFDTQGDLI